MTLLASTAASSAGAGAASRVPSAALSRIRDAIYETSGIFQADNRLYILESRCQKRMQALGIANLNEYYECLTSRPMHRAELVSLLNEITVGETCFFRNRPQFEAIRKIVLPRVMAAKSQIALRHLRVWSAGCSTGEEPYGLAMLLMDESAGQLKGWTFEVIATDINENSISHAQAGRYGDYSTRNTEPVLLHKYFSAEGKEYCVKPEVKSHVSFKHMNLSDDSRMMFMKGLDVILCCNVLIYFDVASKKRVIQHFHDSLFGHGYLFLGHAESLYGVSGDFQLVHLPSTTAYVKAQPAAENEGGQ